MWNWLKRIDQVEDMQGEQLLEISKGRARILYSRVENEEGESRRREQSYSQPP